MLLLACSLTAACQTSDPSNLLALLLSNRSPLFLSIASPTGPGNKGKQIEDQLLLVISQSTTSLYCSFEDVNIPSVLDALHVAHLRGVEVKVGLEDDNKGYIGYRVLSAYLTTTGFNRRLWTGNAGAGGVYLNMCVADQIFTWLSTSPPTMQGIYSETAFSMIIRTEEDSMARKFAMEADVVTHGTFGSARQRLNQRNYWLVTGLNLGLYFSPEEDPVEGFLLSRIRSANSSITGYSSEFLSNELDGSKVRESKDLAFEIKNSQVPYKQIIGSYSAEVLLDSDEVSKTNSLKYLRNNGVSVPVVAGGWPDNGLNFIITGRGGPSALAFVSSHPYSTKADSSHDGFLMAFDHPSVVGQLSALYEELLNRSYQGGASSAAEDPAAANGLEVVISEINWMGGYKANGTTTTTYEYVELYNNGMTARNISGWRFSCGSNGSFSTVYTIPSGTLIGAKDYLVITGSSTSNTLLAQAHVKVSAGSSLISDTTTEQCRLTASNGVVVDTAGAQGVRFSSNTEVFGLNDTTNKIKRSMERTDLATAGNNTTNWHTNTTPGFMTNYNIGKDFIDRTFGTPGLPNTTAGVRTFSVLLASAAVNNTSVVVTFSEAPDSAAASASNYTIGVGSCASTLAVSGASISGNDVTLTTAAQAAGTLYTVCVSNVKSAANGTAMTISQATFYAFVAQCVSPNVKITEFHAAPNASNADPNFDGLGDSTQDEFVEIKNVSGTACGLVGYVITDKDAVKHTFGAGAALGAGQRYVIYGGGTPPSLGTAITDVANGGGGLGLNNNAGTTGEAVKLCTTGTGCASVTCTAAAPELDCASWGPLTDPDSSGSNPNRASYARTAETGAFAFHHTLTPNELFSPGYAPGSMVPYVYQFAGAKTAPRALASTSPSTTIRIQFSTAMTAGTLTNANIKLFRDTADTCSQNEVTLGGVSVTTTTLTNDTVTFTPSTTLDEPATYCVRVSTSVTSANAVALSTDAVYEFYTQAPAAPGPLRINEIGNGIYNTTANDFIELINTGSTDIDLGAGGYYIQRDSGCNLSSITEKIALTGTVPAGGYFVISRSGSTLPNVNMYSLSSFSGGDCAILTTGNTSVTSATDGQVLDFVATTGSADTEGGVTAPDISANHTAVSRMPDGTDTNVNSSDFTLKAPTPGGQNGVPMYTSTPTSGATSVALNSDIVITFNEAMNTGTGTVNVVGSTSGAQNGLTCTWTNGPAPVINNICTINPPTDFSSQETVTVTLVNIQNPSTVQPANTSFSFTAVNSALSPTVTNVVVASTNPNNGTTPYNTGTATVTLTGTNFTGVSCPSGVRLDNTDEAGTAVNTVASSCTVDSGTQITATFPAGIRTNGTTGWNVIVTNANGSNSVSTVKFVPKAGLLISEISTTDTGGSATCGSGACREYIEIFNPTANTITVDGFTIRRKTAGGTFASFFTITANSCATNGTYGTFTASCAVPSRGFFLMVSSDYVAANGATGDFRGFTAAMANTANGIQLRNSSGQSIDVVCFGTHTVTTGCESTTIADPATAGSIERKAQATSTGDTNGTTGMVTGGGHAASGNAYDTDVNSADWVGEATSKNPQNRYNGGTE